VLPLPAFGVAIVSAAVTVTIQSKAAGGSQPNGAMSGSRNAAAFSSAPAIATVSP
jgi:hypothetical protein